MTKLSSKYKFVFFFFHFRSTFAVVCSDVFQLQQHIPQDSGSKIDALSYFITKQENNKLKIIQYNGTNLYDFYIELEKSAKVFCLLKKK